MIDTVGMRNNNPLNIRKTGERWAGSVVETLVNPFVKFQSNIYGYRAAFIILHKYITQYRSCTIEAIISRWAPPTENVVENYVKFVSAHANIPRKEPLAFTEQKRMCRLVAAMAEYESKIIDDEEAIAEGYKMACRAKKIKLCYD